MNKHTPGPWTISESATHVTVRNREGDAVFHDDKRLDGVLGDAHLIAAAPELLEALEDLVCLAERAMRESESGEWMVDEELRDARDAIEKARGET
jgi:hypothetical protein